MGKKKILIVDDEVNFTKLVKFNLEKTGKYEVKAENDGKCGLDAVKTFKPDLILLDIVMPGMDGGDVARQIEEEESVKNIPIVFLTAIATKKETTSRGGVIGGRSFIAKPVDTKELIDCIEKNIGKPR